MTSSACSGVRSLRGGWLGSVKPVDSQMRILCTGGHILSNHVSHGQIADLWRGFFHAELRLDDECLHAVDTSVPAKWNEGAWGDGDSGYYRALLPMMLRIKQGIGKGCHLVSTGGSPSPLITSLRPPMAIVSKDMPGPSNLVVCGSLVFLFQGYMMCAASVSDAHAARLQHCVRLLHTCNNFTGHVQVHTRIHVV